jgi:hypothetical protein
VLLLVSENRSRLVLGEDRLMLVTDDAASAIKLRDKNGKERLVMVVNEGLSIGAKDKNGNIRIGMIVTGDGEDGAGIFIARADGTLVFETPVEIKRNATETKEYKEYLKLKKKFE